IRATRGKTEEEAGYVGGNAATLLVKRDPSALEGCDLSGCVVLGGDFVGASLRDANFAGASLKSSVFTKVLGSILAVAYSPDDRVIATAIAIWKFVCGK
ncbi:MAG: pentapeptide repeat-containing protein, partial [Hydrococcus sp. RM1_1_31]|nr:pentapeptide repeat-containing protein [Hydrococcus sp. RM1_1_31]